LASKKKRERLSEGGAAARPCSATDAALLHAALGIVTRGLKPDGRRAAPTAEIYELEAPLLARLVWPYAEGTLAVAVRARAEPCPRCSTRRVSSCSCSASTGASGCTTSSASPRAPISILACERVIFLPEVPAEVREVILIFDQRGRNAQREFLFLRM
jgi:hypothetical protein